MIARDHAERRVGRLRTGTLAARLLRRAAAEADARRGRRGRPRELPALRPARTRRTLLALGFEDARAAHAAPRWNSSARPRAPLASGRVEPGRSASRCALAPADPPRRRAWGRRSSRAASRRTRSRRSGSSPAPEEIAARPRGARRGRRRGPPHLHVQPGRAAARAAPRPVRASALWRPRRCGSPASAAPAASSPARSGRPGSRGPRPRRPAAEEIAARYARAAAALAAAGVDLLWIESQYDLGEARARARGGAARPGSPAAVTFALARAWAGGCARPTATPAEALLAAPRRTAPRPPG